MSDIILAIDPADEGADSSVMCFMRGGDVIKFEEHKTLNEVKVAHLALLRVKEMKIHPKNVIVDAVGVGAGCLNTLVQEGVYAVRFIGSAKPSCALPFYDFKNKRAEAAWLLREAFKNRRIKLYDHCERLKNELLATHYYIDNEKTIALPLKRDIKRKLGHSPDFFDALCMANYLYAQGASSKIKAMSARAKRVSPVVQGF